jgi:alkylated DNA nucleotide flippase Atl1
MGVIDMKAVPTEYAERVLDAVDRIPYGQVMAYSDVAEWMGEGSARGVGTVMARWGGGVAWHRVVRSDGTPAPHIRMRQLAMLRAEGVPIRGERVEMSRARWDGRS